MHHMQQNISAPGKDIKTFTFTDSNQVIPGQGNPQKRRTMFGGYLFKYCCVKYQTFHKINTKKLPEKLFRCLREP